MARGDTRKEAAALSKKLVVRIRVRVRVKTRHDNTRGASSSFVPSTPPPPHPLDKTTKDKIDNTTRHNTQFKTTQDNSRQDNSRQDKTRQGNTRVRIRVGVRSGWVVGIERFGQEQHKSFRTKKKGNERAGQSTPLLQHRLCSTPLAPSFVKLSCSLCLSRCPSPSPLCSLSIYHRVCLGRQVWHSVCAGLSLE